MKKLLTAAISAMVLVSVALAAPNPDKTRNINKFGHTGFWNTHSAQTLGQNRLSINAYGNHAIDKKFIKNIYVWGDDGKLYLDPNFDSKDANDFLRETFNAGIAYGITRSLDIAVMIPVYVDDILGTTLGNLYHGSLDGIDDLAKYSVGDMEVSFKWQYPPYPHRKFFEIAYYGALSIPTGQDSRGYFPRRLSYTDQNTLGINNYYTSNKVDADLKMIWTLDFREMLNNFPVLFHANYGMRWTFQRSNEHNVYLNAGIEVRPTDWFAVLAEVYAAPRFGTMLNDNMLYVDKSGNILTKPRNWRDDPVRVTPGLAFLTPIGFTFTAGLDISLADDKDFFYGNKGTESDEKSSFIIETAVEPKLAFVASAGWNFLTVKREEPIIIPEPEPTVDTIFVTDTIFVDRVDTIMVDNETAPVNTFTITASVVAGQGTISPVGVNIVNEGAYQTYTFTPAEGFSIEQVTVNGINQGVLAQYTFTSVKENQVISVSFKEEPKPVEIAPTPVAIEIPKDGLVLRGVNFQSGKAILTANSYEALDAVVKSLKEWSEVRIEVQGHTDNTGNREANMKLSKERAIAVAMYFVNQGIAKNRIRPVGYGPDFPIADNSTASGRELNRRVEIKRFD